MTARTLTAKFRSIYAALRAEDGSLWASSDAVNGGLAKGKSQRRTISQGDYDALVAGAPAGVPIPALTTLRMRTRVAAFWPSDRRVAGASFTAHRRAQEVGDLDKATTILTTILKGNGGQCPERKVVAAVRAANGTPPSKPAASQPASQPAGAGSAASDVLGTAGDMSAVDRLIAQARAMTAQVLSDASDADLVRLVAALESASKVVADHQEARRRKAARQGATAKAVGTRAKAKAQAKPTSQPKPKAQAIGARG